MARKSRKITKYTLNEQVQRIHENRYIAGLYGRISVESEEKINRNTMGIQIKLLQEFAATIPDLEVGDIYIDDDVSGTNFNRPAYERMMEDVEKGLINCIIVKDLSRFARNHISAGEYLGRVFPEKGVRFIAITDNLDTAENDGGIVVPIKNLINEKYAKDIAGKIKSTFKMMQKNGDFCSSKAPYGYQRSLENKHQFVVDTEAAEVVKQMFKWYSNGATTHWIAKTLMEMNVPCPAKYMYNKELSKSMKSRQDYWHPKTVREILSAQVYCGDMVQNKTESAYLETGKKDSCIVHSEDEWVIVRDMHEPLIDRKLFIKVQNLLAQRAEDSMEKKGKNDNIKNPEYCLSGVLRCIYCGSPMNVKRSLRQGKVHYRYICPKNDAFGAKGCEKKLMDFKNTNEIVLLLLKRYCSVFLDTEKALCDLNSTNSVALQRKKLNEKLRENRSMYQKKSVLKQNLYHDYVAGLLDQTDYVYMSDQYSEEIREIEKKKQAIQMKLVNLKEDDNVNKDLAREMRKVLRARILSRQMVNLFIESIETDNDGTFDIQMKLQDEYAELMSKYLIRKEEEVEDAS